MYSVSELAKMYNCTRQTIYVKLDRDELKPFLTVTDTGKKLTPEWLNLLNIIMADSKVTLKDSDANRQDEINHSDNTNYQELYIKELKDKIEYLNNVQRKLEDEKKELAGRVVFLTDELISNQKLLNAPKGFLKKLFQ